MLSYPSSDIRSVAQDVIVPPMVQGIAAAGTRVRETHPDYRQTQVYHDLPAKAMACRRKVSGHY